MHLSRVMSFSCPPSQVDLSKMDFQWVQDTSVPQKLLIISKGHCSFIVSSSSPKIVIC